ncbi:ExeA family protein [Rhodospirillum sp. A1_3_36]|uniref:ExeA family protein n=1 Tax=Rhodospirillum sp. A1_3_36 TaxID=3391666 RepID=UPI0039A46B89
MAHWSLRHHPFPVDPGLDLAFSTGTDRDPARRLLARIHADPRPALVVGDAGMGKTYLARWVAAVLRRRDRVIRLSARSMDADGLLATVCRDLGLDPTRSIAMPARVLAARLLALGLGGRRVILIVDDAENLEEQDALDLFHLDSLVTNRGRLIRMVLLGRPEMRARLALCPSLMARMGAMVGLEPLRREDCLAYFDQRVEQARTSDRALFTPAAKDVLVRESQGVPGTLDALAARAMDLALADGAVQVDREHARVALRILGGAGAPAPAPSRMFSKRGPIQQDALAGSLTPCTAFLSS